MTTHDPKTIQHWLRVFHAGHMNWTLLLVY